MTPTYFSQKPAGFECILPPELLVAKWSHSITFDPAFLTEWGAVENARNLAFELGSYDGVFRDESPSFTHVPTSSSHCRQVSFCNDVDVLVGHDHDFTMSRFCILHSELQSIDFEADFQTITTELQACSRRTDVDPLSSLAVCISSPVLSLPDMTLRVTDQWHHPLPPEAFDQQQEQEPDPDVIPEPVAAPAFVHDLFIMAERHGAFTDLDSEDTFRVRTWYIHHVSQQRMLDSRILEFTEDWRRWESDLRGSWRDLIIPDQALVFSVASPDPYRGYLLEPTHADIILSQGIWTNRMAGIVTTHFAGSSAQPITFANAASFEPVVSGFDIAVAADAFHWCNSASSRCTTMHGWIDLPFDHQRRHHMHNGHAFVLHIQKALHSIKQAGASDQHSAHERHASGSQGSGSAPFGSDRFDFQADHALPGGDQSPDQPPQGPPSDGPQDHESDVSIHSGDKGILVYRLHARDEHCFVAWTTYMSILDGIIHELRLPRSQIRAFHRLLAKPPDVQEFSEEAVILQTIHDIPPGSDEKLILVDTVVHFHPLTSGLAVPAATSRQVMRVNSQLHRSHLLILLRLDDYCRMQHDRCVIHRNHYLWDVRERALHDVSHGDYIRVQVPPPHDLALDTETAIDIARGTLDTTMYDCATGSPNVHLSMMQTAVQVFSHNLQACDVVSPVLQLRTDPSEGDHPHVDAHDMRRTPHRNRLPPHTPTRGRFADGHQRRLARLVDEADLVECEEEGRVAYITTWYLHHAEETTCRLSRSVRLVDHPDLWIEIILEAWHDVIRPGQQVTMRLVDPQPPSTAFECTQAHVIVEQGPPAERVSFVISVVDAHQPDQRQERIQHSAHSDSDLQTRSSVLHLASILDLGPQDTCSVT